MLTLCKRYEEIQSSNSSWELQLMKYLSIFLKTQGMTGVSLEHTQFKKKKKCLSDICYLNSRYMCIDMGNNIYVFRY